MRPSTEDGDLARPRLFDLVHMVDVLDRLYPRFMNQIDRDPDSPTFGSCDRNFWMCRLHEFDSGVLQQGGLVLSSLAALAERAATNGCRYLEPAHAGQWRSLAGAVNRRTAGLLERNGYLDEYYPGERSFPGTVFAAYATLKSAADLGDSEIVEHPGLRRCAESLIARRPSAAANQDTACAAFLALYARLNDWRRDRVGEVVDRLLAGPEGDGLFTEYGGGDLGYASVSLNYLACLAADGTHDVSGPLEDLAGFIADFVGPSGHLGGEYASRSTTYFLPFGLLVAARRAPHLASRFDGLDLDYCFGRLDDRYVMHYTVASLASAAAVLAEQGPPPAGGSVLARRWEVADHRERKLLAVGSDDSAVFVGLAKGLTVQAEHGDEVIIDCGYRLARGGKVYATAVIDPEAAATVDIGDDGVRISAVCRFQRYRILTPSTFKTIVLRLLSFAGPWLNRMFKRALIQSPQALPGVALSRVIVLEFASGRLTIEDSIDGLAEEDEVRPAPASSLRLVPSARFLQDGELDASGDLLPPLASRPKRQTKTFELKSRRSSVSS